MRTTPLTLKQRTSYALPTTDRSAVAGTAITLRKPLDREAQLRAELAAAKARLAEIDAAAQAAAEAERAKEQAALAEAARIGRETIARAAREERIREAPGFREVDGLAAFRAKLGINRHTTRVVITGSTVSIKDLA
jgi:hypothetical protein